MKASDLDYDLPEERIAQVPCPQRSGSRLLHLPGSGPPIHREFREFPGLLRPGDILVLNETRVIPARLALRRKSGGAVEALLVRPEGKAWRALLRPARRLRPGEVLTGEGGAYTVRLRALQRGEGLVELEGGDGAEILERFGRVPLPPYVRRDPTPEDQDRYQTVYARVPGAVAAPTAGLHLDGDILEAIGKGGVGIARLVLHIGPGTFRPLPDGDLGRHRLDPERYAIPDATRERVRRTRTAGGRVVAVGTTVVRALESDAAAPGRSETDLFVRPGYEFRVVDALLTNFHLPRSSLLCLVAAFSGTERILAAYREAVRKGYRFYSYGDATFLERP